MVTSCRKDEDVDSTNNNDLEFISKISINVTEPSGLAIDEKNDVLYTVSDNTNNIYKLSKNGSVLKEYNIDADDLEGITIFNSELLIVDERTKQIIEYNPVNNELTKHTIDYENTEANSGFEGITYNSDDDVIYVLNEKNPGQLLTFNNNYNIINTVSLSFANDYSGIFYDNKKKVLWIVSDASATVNKCTLTGELINSYSLDIDKCEGVAIDNKLGYIYFVSDSESKLYTYKLI